MVPHRGRRRLLQALGAAAAIGGSALALAWVTLPDVAPLRDGAPARTRAMEERALEHGLPADAFALRVTPLAEHSPYLVCAVVHAEDGEYFAHRGVDWSRTWSAFARYVRGHPGGGASTITQQLARNVFLSEDRAAARKAREILLALKLERALEKPRILELYLSVAQWGRGDTFGGTAAAHWWFRVPSSALAPSEAVFLAGILASPRRALDADDRGRARAVQARALNGLRRAGLIDDAVAQQVADDLIAMEDALARQEPLYQGSSERLRPMPARSIDDVLRAGCGPW